MFFIVGLGNPGQDYEKTRHNAGRIALDYVYRTGEFDEWIDDVKTKSHIAKGKIAGKRATLIMPNNFMNNSGKSVNKYITNAKKLEKLIVVYDDVDLPLGSFRISHNRGSGGHNGIESIIKSLGSKAFTRVRVGISPTTPAGKIKKPKGEKKVLDFLMGDFSKKELEITKKISKNILGAIEVIIKKGRINAMNEFN